MIANLDTMPLGVTEDEGFRISLAGAQEKTVLLFRNGQWFKPHGTTATTHILKPSIGRLSNGIDLTSSAENEYFCLKVLAALGMDTAKAEVKTFGEKSVLIVERFDRIWTADGRLLRLPQEDCCQALSVPPSRKYQTDGGPGIEQILQLLRGSDESPADQRRFLKANIFFWLLGATDGHAKNFSVFLHPGGRFQLAPFYDVISAQPSVDSKQVLWKHFRLAMSFGDKPFGAKEDRASCTWEKCSRSGTAFVGIGIYRASSRTVGAVGFCFSVSSHAEGVVAACALHVASG